MALAVFGLVGLLTGWTDWPWWIGLGLMSPLGALVLFDDVIGDIFFGDSGDGDVGGDFDSGSGDFSSGGGGDGGG